jgi:hypothetical protein
VSSACHLRKLISFIKGVGSLSLFSVDHGATNRSTRDTLAAVGDSCSAANAKQTSFLIAPRGAMPPVEGCTKQDYAVLIVIGVGVED